MTIEEALVLADDTRVKLPGWVSLPQNTDPDPRLGELRWGHYGPGRGQWAEGFAEGFVRWRILSPVVYADAGFVGWEHTYEGEWFDLKDLELAEEVGTSGEGVVPQGK